MSKLSLTRRAIVVGFDDTTRVSWSETLSRCGFVPIEFKDTREILDAYRNLDPGVLVLGFEPDNVHKAFLDDLADCPAPPPVLIARSKPTDQAARSAWTGYLEYIGDVDGDGGIQNSLERATRFRELQLSVARMNGDRATMETELSEAQARLIQAQRMATLGSMLAGLAHEIKTPLGSINRNSDVLDMASDQIKEKFRDLTAENPDVASECEDTCSILDDTLRMNRIASDRLLEIVKSARSFARTNTAEKESADIHEGIESSLTLAAHELKGRIEVVKEFGPLPRCDCYPGQLNQVILNLLVNAAQAIEGSGTIRIRTWDEDGTARISISDDGQGMSDAIKERIFETGFTTKASDLGSGLGLSISNSIIQNHGGRIEVDSEPGKGATFTIILPRTGKL